ncbi:unnamed protein product [Ilex paraguariensis]|uniref:Uncharacterized protein n=1 Tax=Ilex paraguariensis TaxID=185542 RepID=A0ABC8RF38_9AQUA
MGEVPWAPPGEARKIPLGVALLGEAPSGKAPWALSIEQGDRSMSRLAYLGVKYRETSSGVVHEVTQLGVECEVAQIDTVDEATQLGSKSEVMEPVDGVVHGGFQAQSFGGAGANLNMVVRARGTMVGVGT